MCRIEPQRIFEIQRCVTRTINQYKSPTPLALADALKLHVVQAPFDNSMVIGMIASGKKAYMKKSQYNAVIVVNPELTSGEKVFAIAHEIGHYIMHKDILERKEVLRNERGVNGEREVVETEADFFADFLLEQLYGVSHASASFFNDSFWRNRILSAEHKIAHI